MVRALEELADALSRLPTIGKKSSWRLALFLMERDEQELRRLADHIATIRQKVTTCRTCFCYSETEICPVCASPNRNQSTICVVEKPTDLFSIERSGRYRGVYHVLGGVLSPINGITAEKLHIAALTERVTRDKPQELILGLGAGADAETTALYLARLLAHTGVRVTRLARGLPAGIELEYVDQITLCQALSERTEIHYGEARS
jgi:recombination protein RecR